jgi:predicted GIY-YIG superfamily endonuclease
MENYPEFLKRHSTIPNDFIDSFLSMYDPNTSQTDIILELGVVAKWIKANKHNLTQTLKASYQKDIDYTIERITCKNGRKYGGNNCKRILISPDCFKRLCMRSNTPKAEEVRSYFIALESLLIKYRSVLVDGMKADIQKLEKELGPKDAADSAGYVYILKASEEKDSVYKIGRTKDLNRRLSEYKTGRYDDVDVLFKYRTDNLKATEACMKAFLKEFQLRKYKELYQVNINVIKAIISGCDEIPLKKEFALRKASTKTGGYYVYLQPTTV